MKDAIALHLKPIDRDEIKGLRERHRKEVDEMMQRHARETIRVSEYIRLKYPEAKGHVITSIVGTTGVVIMEPATEDLTNARV